MNNRRDLIVFIMCLIPAIILFYMSSECLDHGRQMYELYTGIFCGIFCFIPWLMEHFRVMHLPLWMVLFILLAIFFHAYGVLLLEYDNKIWYDNITHTFSSCVISLCTILTLFTLQKYNGCIHFTVPVTALFVLFVMMSFGVIWEVFEFIVDISTGTHMQYCPWDTIRDMICNSLGSLIASLIITVAMRRTSIDELIESINIHPVLRKFLGSSDH